MLVLTRKSQDSIRIGDNITVTVLRIKGNTVRIGIEAPDSVRIVRGELPVFIPRSPPRCIRHKSGRMGLAVTMCKKRPISRCHRLRHALKNTCPRRGKIVTRQR